MCKTEFDTGLGKALRNPVSITLVESTLICCQSKVYPILYVQYEPLEESRCNQYDLCIPYFLDYSARSLID